MKTLFACLVIVSIGPIAGPGWCADAPGEGGPGRLRPVSSFASIADREARSAALFAEAAKVIQSPRCLNCHPAARSPTQGNDLHAHVPPMNALAAGHGRPGFQCATCHQAANVGTQRASIASIPGNPHWGLAPAPMAWQGLSTGDVCRQLKDPSLNGGRSLAKVHEHVTNDSLVGWAWNPGEGRQPAPGTQAEFAALLKAWMDSGAFCPR